jgi:hypothetical protein
MPTRLAASALLLAAKPGGTQANTVFKVVLIGFSANQHSQLQASMPTTRSGYSHQRSGSR